MDAINLNRKGTEDEMMIGLNGGLTQVLGLGKTGLASEPPYSHNNNVGQDLTPAHNLFSIGSNPKKLSGGARAREVMSFTQKRKKQGRKVVGKENFMQEVREYDHGEEKVHDMMEVTEDNEIGLKRTICSPLKEIVLEEGAGKKQKIDVEVMTLSKLMAQELG